MYICMYIASIAFSRYVQPQTSREMLLTSSRSLVAARLCTTLLRLEVVAGMWPMLKGTCLDDCSTLTENFLWSGTQLLASNVAMKNHVEKNKTPPLTTKKTKNAKAPYFFPLVVNSFESTRDGAPGTTVVSCPLVLPHEIFAALHTAGPERFAKAMGTAQSVRIYWDHARRHSVWAANHAGLQVPDLVYPLAVYGDGVKVTRSDVVLSITWNSLLVKASPAIDSRHLIAALPVTHLTPTSLDEVMRVVCWSLAAMFDGFHPCTDHLGREWPKNSRQAFRSGTPLAGGAKACLTEGRGDWEFLSKFWHVPSAQHSAPCMFCTCTQFGPTSWTRLSQQPLRPDDWFPKRNPLTRLGVTVSMLRYDLMHIVQLGVAQWVNGASLLWLCQKGFFEGDSLAQQLASAWCRFKRWAAGLGLTPTQKVFTGRRLLCHIIEYVELQGKAWNSRLITSWLAVEMAQIEAADEETQLITSLQFLLSESSRFLEVRGRYLLPEEGAQYNSLVTDALLIYRELARRNYLRGRLWHPLRPKLHAWAEIGRVCQADLINPRFYSTTATPTSPT